MKLQIDTAYSEMLRLTEEQYDVLASIDENKRAFVYGAAGTGKSLLAVEKLRQNIVKNRKCAYICFNKNMAAYVEQNVSAPRESFIGTYHSLLGKYVDDSHELNVEEINDRFLAMEDCEVDKFEILIIDEAQDILSQKTIKCLEQFIEGGMDRGEWILFADPNQDIFMKGENYAATVSFLKDTYYPCFLRLNKNCRNTAQIARRNSVLTSTPPSKYLKLSGPEVKAFEFSDDNKFIDVLEREISSLLSGGTYVKDIIILSTKRLENSMLSEVDSLADVELVEVRNIKSLKKNQLNYMTVQSFKGLESKVIFYVDIEGFDSPENRRLNYVAMSRAEILLYYFYPQKMKAEYEHRVLEGMEVLE